MTPSASAAAHRDAPQPSGASQFEFCRVARARKPGLEHDLDMPIFYLEPKNGDVSDPSWEASSLKEGCWTDARREELARLQVQGATQKMVDLKPGRQIIFSPWIQSALTDCKLDNPPRDFPADRILTRSGQLLDFPWNR